MAKVLVPFLVTGASLLLLAYKFAEESLAPAKRMQQKASVADAIQALAVASKGNGVTRLDVERLLLTLSNLAEAFARGDSGRIAHILEAANGQGCNSSLVAPGQGAPVIVEGKLTGPPSSKPNGDRTREGLTPREQQIAGLITQGFTNREIATALWITERTAATHVQHILNKLGFNSRAQIAAWTLTHTPAVGREQVTNP